MPPQGAIRFDAIGRAWELYKSQMGMWLLISLIVLVVSLAVNMAERLLLGISMLPLQATSPDTAPAAVTLFLPTLIGVLVINLAVNYMIHGAVLNATIQQVSGAGLRLRSLTEVTAVLGDLIVVALLQTLAGGIGLALCILPALVVMGLLMFSIPLVVDRKARGVEAIRPRFEMLKSQWLMATLFYVVVAIIGYGVGSLLCGVGLLFTLPLYFLSIAVACEDFVGGVPQA